VSRKTVNVISLSFLDLISLGLGAVILLMIVFAAMMNGQRRDRRHLVLSFDLQFVGGNAKEFSPRDALAARLQGRASFDPSDFFEVVLYDPDGQEHRPHVASLRGGVRPVSHSVPRPAYGVWRLYLRQRGARAAPDHSAPAAGPPGVQPLADFLDGLAEGRQRPKEEWLALKGEADELAARTRGGGRWQLLQRIRAYLRRGLPATELASRALAVRDLLTDAAGRDRLPPRGDLDRVLHAACEVELFDALARGDHHQPALDRAARLHARLAELRPLFRNGDKDDPLTSFELEVIAGHHLRPWDQRSRPTRLLLLLGLGSKVQTVSPGGERGEFDVDTDDDKRHAQSLVRWGLAAAGDPPSAALARLALDGRFGVREVGGPSLPSLLTADTHRLRDERIEARLAEIERHGKASPLPAFLLVELYADGGLPGGLGPAAETLFNRLDKEDLDKQAPGDSYRDRAGVVPGLYAEAWRAARSASRFGVSLNRVFLHWGSQVVAPPGPIPVAATSLRSAEPVFEFVVGPDEVKVLTGQPGVKP